ncbi:hypothetical protein KEM54_000255 [Ascosphaera aggregata]|nr:hypothetical protein KEM54_000255 [Ascosphaera aggregata]
MASLPDLTKDASGPPTLEHSVTETLHLTSHNIHIELTYQPLSSSKSISQIRHPSAGANVLFIGTTRDTFDGKPVRRLSYSAYVPMAMQSLCDIAKKIKGKEKDVRGISIAHRLGDVPVGEESIIVGVSSGHREAGWRAGEEVLEEVKRRVEIWKEEVFANQDGRGGESRVWKANKDTRADGSRVENVNHDESLS